MAMRFAAMGLLPFLLGAVTAQAHAETAILAGGCFWSVESNFDKVEGVTETVSGYIGGHVDNPTYEQVVREDTGHYEAVRITFDPAIVSYERLLTTFWHTVDPTDAGGQFCDRGDSYRTAIFAVDADQTAAAEASKAAIAESSGYQIVTEILSGHVFYEAEGYHQNFHITNPVRYEQYRIGCRRDERLAQLWGDDAFLGTTDNPIAVQ